MIPAYSHAPSAHKHTKNQDLRLSIFQNKKILLRALEAIVPWCHRGAILLFGVTRQYIQNQPYRFATERGDTVNNQ